MAWPLIDYHDQELYETDEDVGPRPRDQTCTLGAIDDILATSSRAEW